MERIPGKYGTLRVPEGTKDYIEAPCSVCGEEQEWVKPESEVDTRYCGNECWEHRTGECVNCGYRGKVEEWEKSYFPNGETKGRSCPDCSCIGHVLVDNDQNSGDTE